MRILIIEDDHETAGYLAKGLKEAGHVADVAGDGEDGLHLASSRDYDVLVVDRMLPKRDGLSLIAATRNGDEIAFVVGHEASHHILNHLERKTGAATAGAVILGSIASVYGGDQSAIETAQRIGASVGSRYYSKEWELQADYLGAIIAVNAGFDPVLGSQFFLRIPDPGDHILGTHPSRASRLAQVNRAVADVASGRVR